MNREIITLQLGHLTNSIGVHFWNHFHQENLQTQRYFTPKGLPRALIVDYRNAFGNLIEESSNSSMPKNLSSLQIIQRMVGEPFWSKDLHSSIHFHPKSLIPLQGQWVQPDGEENPFDLYPTGEQMFQRMFDQFESSIHYLLESADSLESFRCLFDVNNGFSGLFTSIQDYLTDECPKRPIWSFGLANSSFSTLNFALALSHSIDENQMPTIPCLTSSNPFYQALAMQQSLFTSSIPLDLLADHLCPSKNFLLNLQWKIPFDLEQKTLYQYLESTEPFLLKDPIACHCFVRGIDQTALYNRSLYNWNISDPGEMLETYFRDRFGSKMFVSSCSWKEKFDRSAMLTGLINDRASALELVNKLQNDLKKISWKTLSKRWEENDFDQEQFTETINRIDRLNELYQNPIDLI